jgi:deoxycytidylate deaminase
MKATEQAKLTSEKRKSIRETLRQHGTNELVIGLCGKAGSITGWLLEMLKEEFSVYSYDVHTIKVSNFIKDSLKANDKAVPSSEFEKTKALQDEGDEIRKNNANDMLAAFAVNEINQHRILSQAQRKYTGRIVYIIDSIKHPAETLLLKATYGMSYYLLGVVATQQQRKNELVNKKQLSKIDADTIINRDEKGEDENGQQVAGSLHHADFFVRSVNEEQTRLRENIARYLQLIFGRLTSSPTLDEYAMFIAYATGLRSGCMSRQVGAAIVSEEHEIIATGRNDVPIVGGGLAKEEDSGAATRCMNLPECMCSNDENRLKLLGAVEDTLKKLNIPSESTKKIMNEFKNSRQFKGIVEFSRAIHAEMDAIVSAARTSQIGLKNSTLYCTTYPCHNCARHIVAAGVKKVVYIEPYDKSFASTLHSDALSSEDEGIPRSGKRVVLMEPFIGVSPKQYILLFRAGKRKSNGRHVSFAPKAAKPMHMESSDSISAREQLVISCANQNPIWDAVWSSRQVQAGEGAE